MDDHVTSIQNDDEDDITSSLIRIENEDMVESTIVSDLPKNEPGEEMIMVDPSLVTGTAQDTKSTTVPINLILQDGSVLQLNAVTNGDVDLVTLQNLVSAQLLQQNADSLKSELITLTPVAAADSCGQAAGGSLLLTDTAQPVLHVVQPPPLTTVTSEVSLISNDIVTSQHNLNGIVASQQILNGTVTSPESSLVTTQVQDFPVVSMDVKTTMKSNGAANNLQALIDKSLVKQKGGWPKGKKRKPVKRFNAPKPPITAYGRFTQVRRVKLQEESPGLTFAEQVKLMGREWSFMGKEDKQRYLDDAAVDKQRYMTELAVYQQSAEYRQFMADSRSHGKAESSFDTLSNIGKSRGLQDDTLYCEACDLYFTNLHNKKEHFLGQRHLNNISKLYEADLAKRRAEGELCDVPLVEAVTVEVTQLPDVTDVRNTSQSLELHEFVDHFIHRNDERERELVHCRGRAAELRDAHVQLQHKCAELKAMEEAYSADLATMRTYGAALSTQIDGLLLVPNLFQGIQL